MSLEYSASLAVKRDIRLEIYAIGLIALSGILYGFLGYFGTQLLRVDLSIESMLFWRFFVAALWIMLFTLWSDRKMHKPISWRHYLKPYLLGGLGYGGASMFFFTACQSTGTGIAMVIFFSFPMFVALYGLKKNHWRMSRMTMGSLAAILLGLILLRGNDAHAVSVFGILFAVLSAVFYAFYVFKSKHMMQRVVANHFATMVCLGSAIFFLVISLATHQFVMPHALSAWGYVVALAVIATAIPIQLLLAGLKTISPLKASILSVLEPVVTLLLGVAYLNEAISLLQIYGVIVVILGATLIQFSRD